jgi:hypothetical protein
VRRAMWVWVLLFGCASAPAAVPDRPLTPGRLFPLELGSAWSYDVDTGDGSAVLAVVRVTEAAHGRAVVHGGEGATHYELRPDGVYRQDRDGYLLKAPLQQGAGWDSGRGMRAEITRTDARFESVAGSFAGCVEVIERGAPSGAIITTVYCPDVGPVSVISALDLTAGQVRVVATLRGYRIGTDSGGTGTASHTMRPPDSP